MLDAANISVQRGPRTILHSASIQIAPGVFNAIVGPNGSGKSTLLRALAGIWPVSAGSVTLEGELIGRVARKKVAQKVAYVPQETGLDFAFTVAETVAMGRYPHRGRFAPESAADRQAVESALMQCDALQLKDRTVNTLSGGERQRALIARSLAVEPRFILLDEPTANLDVQHAMEVLELCRRLAEAGHGVAVATHDLNAAARYADRVALVDSGTIARYGPREEVLTADTVRAVFGVNMEAVESAGGHAVYVFHRIGGPQDTVSRLPSR